MIKSKNIIIGKASYIVTREGKTCVAYQASEGRSGMNTVFEKTFRFVSEAKKWMAAPVW